MTTGRETDIGRAVGVSHAAVIAALHGVCSGDVGGASWDEKAVAALLAMPGAFAHVADRRGAPVGFVLARVAADEAEIVSIGVAPTARRQGVAAALVDTAIETARRDGAVRMFLEVADDNVAALAFYRGRDFNACGRRAGYYKRADGAVDAQVLVLDLSVR